MKQQIRQRTYDLVRSLGVFSLVMVAAVSCAKKKNTVDLTNPDSYVAKSDIPQQAAFVMAIEDASSAQAGFAVPGFSSAPGVVRTEITETELRFIAVNETWKRPEEATVIAVYPITEHFDVVRDVNDYGEATNKIVEKKDRPWNQRQFMRVNWGEPKTAATSIADLAGSKDAFSVESTKLVLQPKVKAGGGLEFVTEAGLRLRDISSVDMGVSGAAFRVKVRTTLIPVGPSDYIPVAYGDEKFEKFGYFTTSQYKRDEFGNLTDDTLQTYANLFNVCEPGTGRSCSTRQIRWILNEGFPADMLPSTRRAVAEWNETFQKALGRTDDVVVLDEQTQRPIGDTSQNMIAYVEPEVVMTSLAGVSQSVVNDLNGEVISSRVTLFGGGLRYVRERADYLLEQVLSEAQSGQIGNAEKAKVKDLLGDGVLRVQDKVAKLRRPASKPQTKVASISRASLLNSISKYRGAQNKARVQMQEVINRQPDLVQGAASAVSKAMALKNADVKTVANRLLGIDGSLKHAKIPARWAANQATFEESEFADTAIVDYMKAYIAKHRKDVIGKPGQIDVADLREKLNQEVAQSYFYSVLLHEMGHSFGLRHNFAGSTDVANFTDTYKQLKAKANAGDKTVLKAELDRHAYSSIMDYGAALFGEDAGPGPYDKAAILFAYNRGQGESLVAAGKKSYRFCTDDQVMESPLCRRFDEGGNLTVITKAETERLQTNYLRANYRRGRPGFTSSIDSILQSKVESMQEVRSVFDEFLWQLLIAGNGDAGGFPCPAVLAKSINAGEMQNICDPSVAQELGIDFGDLITLRAAINPNKDVEDLIPNGGADLIMSNLIAMEYFSQVIGAPEPGYFVALSGGADQPSVLTRIAGLEDYKTPQEALRAAIGSSDNAQELYAKYADKTIAIKAGRYGKYLYNDFTFRGVQWDLERLGYMVDKMLAMRVLTVDTRELARYRQLDNLSEIQFNAYSLPSTRQWITGLVTSIIAGNNVLATIPANLPEDVNGFTCADGKKCYAVEGSFSPDLRDISVMLSVVSFGNDRDREFWGRMQLCDKNDLPTACQGSESAQFVTSQQDNLFRAVQNFSGNSISYALVKSAQDVTEQISALRKVQEDAPGALKKAVADVKAVVANPEIDKVRAALDAKLNSKAELKKLAVVLTGTGEKGVWATVLKAGQNIDQISPDQLKVLGGQVATLLDRADKAIAKIDDEAFQKEVAPLLDAYSDLLLNQIIGPVVLVYTDYLKAQSDESKATEQLKSQERDMYIIKSIMRQLGS